MIGWNILYFVGKGGKIPNSESAMERMRKHTSYAEPWNNQPYALTVREISLRGGDQWWSPSD
jgi:hypothetical protein